MPTTSEQPGLFGGEPVMTVDATASSSRKASPGGSPQRAQVVLAEIELGRYGVLDSTDRIVVFEDEDHVRHSADEDVVVSLMSAGYATERADGYRVRCRHGAVLRPVTPLRITPAGRALLRRWRSYKPLPAAVV
jgi:hypothetical protein